MLRRVLRCSTARAFTLVELLVVISIVSVLISLLLPAVQAAREAARRIHCANNLKQLALATQNYESARGKLPPSGLVDLVEKATYDSFEQRTGIQLSWAVLLLPYLEQQNLFDQFDLDRTAMQQPNRPQEQSVDLYLCPSDTARGRMFADLEITNGRQFAKGNYAAYVSPFHVDLQQRFPGALIHGGQALRQITDGMSRTIVYSEVRTRDHEQDERGVWALPWTGASLLAYDMHGLRWSSGGVFQPWGRRGATQIPNNQRGVHDPEGNRDVLQICPDVASADLEQMPCFRHSDSPWLSSAPRSLHLDGVNAAFLDGHITFLQNDIDELVMAFLVSINDERVGVDLVAY